MLAGQSLLGFAYYPSEFTDETTLSQPLPRYFDGVVIDFRSVPQPDGNTEGDTRVFPDGTYDEGDTLTHEVGHGVGLYHTFQGGCDDGDDGGDQISDTPTEASPNFLCPEPGDAPRDTCPTEPGLDPVDNFMDYSFDSCLRTFIPEQAARMQFAWQTYRVYGQGVSPKSRPSRVGDGQGRGRRRFRTPFGGGPSPRAAAA